MRSFLGLINYLGRFIPHLATYTEPLRRLTSKGVPWTWLEEQDKCFNHLKSLVSSEKVVCHFRTGQPTKIVVDASPVGLGAILLQRQQEGDFKPVSYASRSLSKVEQRYSQTEREALAVIWACERFHLYVYGKSFIIETDHKPLLGLFGSNGNRSARISRWALRLLQYDFELQYLPGSDNPADVLSRYSDQYSSGPSSGWSSGYELETEKHLNFVIGHSLPLTVTLSQVREASQNDPVLVAVIEALKCGKWHMKPSIGEYKRVSQELSHKGGVLLKNNNLVIPKCLQQHILSLVHRNHMGINKTKSLLRSKVWWPSMMNDVEEVVKNCSSCVLVQPSQKPEPLTMTTMPNCWSKLNVDICGPFPDGWSILGVIDSGSRWPEVFIIKSTKTSVIVNKLKELFCNKGRPLELVSDNGPQFISQEFKDFCKHWGLKHHRVTPLYPQANSEIERFFKTILKTIRLAKVEGKDWKEELQSFLLTYRNTPHATTGKTPAELLYGRNLRDSVPCVEEEPTRCYQEAMTTDSTRKEKIKQQADTSRNLKDSTVQVGDVVVVQQKKKNKFSTNFSPVQYDVTDRYKGTLTIRNKSGVKYKRHVSAVRKTPPTLTHFMNSESDLESDDSYEFPHSIENPPVQPVPISGPGNRERSPSDTQITASEDEDSMPPLSEGEGRNARAPTTSEDEDLSEEEGQEERENTEVLFPGIEDEVNTHLPQKPSSSSSTPFVRRSTRKNAGRGVERYHYHSE